MSDPLLVPVRLDAFVVGDATRASIRRWEMNYANVGDFVTPEQKPFDGTDDQFADDPEHQGVYLMWTLPPGLRHGTQTDAASGAVEFPKVPNRWLVVRFATPKSGDRTTSAWIVESDVADPNGTTFLDPSGKAVHIGRKTLLTDNPAWTEQHPDSTFLRAVGPGNPAFAAYQPHNENIFSIHDRLEKEDALPDGSAGPWTIHYFVAGWYANASDDAFSADNQTKAGGYATLLESLKWSTASSDPATATRSIYHGLLLGVDWDPASQPPTTGRESAQPVVSLGHTSAEALTAFLKHAGLDDSAAELLEAFALGQLDVLQQPGGEAIFERLRHASWFAPGAGGVRWQVADKETAGADPTTLSADELKRELTTLAGLNAAQEDLDASRRVLASMQRGLYELWWKRGYANTLADRPYGLQSKRGKTIETPLDDKAFATALGEEPSGASASPITAAGVQQQMDAIANAQKPLPKATPASAGLDPDAYATTAGLSATRQLKAGLAPRFASPADPVLLVAGLNHGLVMEPEATLACRYPAEVLNDPSAGVTAPTIPQAGLDPVITPLLAEFALLEQLYESSGATFASALPTGCGTPPDLPLEPWEQAWLPLYLEWELAYYPLSYGTAGNWRFDGQDFSSAAAPPTSSSVSLLGRSLIVPSLAFTIRSRVEQVLAAEQDPTRRQQIEDQLKQVKGWDFLSQTLDGLMTQLAGRDPTAAPSPAGDAATVIGDEHHAAPMPGSADAPAHGAAPPKEFDAMCGGQFAFTQLEVVDRFGQTLDILRAGHGGSAPAIAASLDPATPAADAVAELKPRILQGARLRFVPVSSTDDTSELDTATHVNPLCGFLVPDHVDKSLAAHDAGGARLGELRMVGPEGAQTVLWDPAPGSYDPSGDTSPLGTVLSRLRQAGAGALQNFLTAIDETLWTIDPLAGGADDYLTALAGRAIALVRARLALELDGEPLRDPGWAFTFAPYDPFLTSYDFPVQLGAPADREDGLVGYFLESNYTAFRCVRVPDASDLVTDPTGYVQAVQSGEISKSDILLRFEAASAAHATLLIDPRGKVQAHTGLLPTTVLELPPEYLEPALRGLAIAYRAGPLLADDPHVPLMPTPTASGREWSWIESTTTSVLPAVAFPAVDDRARFAPRPPTAREGFVQVDPPGGAR